MYYFPLLVLVLVLVLLHSVAKVFSHDQAEKKTLLYVELENIPTIYEYHCTR